MREGTAFPAFRKNESDDEEVTQIYKEVQPKDSPCHKEESE